MHFDTLTADELSSVLHCLSAKQLTAVKATSRELRMAARRALNAPRFTERKRWAALGAGLIRVSEQGCNDASVRTALDEFEAKYWRRSERPLDFGFGLTFIETDASAWASVSAVGGGYIKAVAPSRCVVRMTGPMEVDCQHVVPRWLTHVLPMWPAPAELEAGMHAMQDWDPRAFSYVMMRQTVLRYFASYASTGVGRTVADCAALRGSPWHPMGPLGATEAQVQSAVVALVNEGHLYSTIDDDHYKVTFP